HAAHDGLIEDLAYCDRMKLFNDAIDSCVALRHFFPCSFAADLITRPASSPLIYGTVIISFLFFRPITTGRRERVAFPPSAILKRASATLCFVPIHRFFVD